MTTVTPDQRELMRHALGLVCAKRPYRNHFFAGPKDEPEWDDLVAQGMATRTPPRPGLYQEPMYQVTEAGIVEASND